MDPTDIKSVIEKLPFKKHATTSEILLLLLAGCTVFGFGWYASTSVKDYFDQAHLQILAAIDKVDQGSSAKVAVVAARVDALTTTAAEHERAINSLRTYYWSNADMQDWAERLDRANRKPGEALTVPEVPRPAGPH